MNYRERQDIAKSPISFSYLKKFNLGAGILHLSQGILMLALGTLLTWERDIYTFCLKLDVTPGPPIVFNIAPDPQVWFRLSYLGVIIASFPLLSALAHLERLSGDCRVCWCEEIVSCRLGDRRAYMKNNTYEVLFMVIVGVKADERKNVLLPM